MAEKVSFHKNLRKSVKNANFFRAIPFLLAILKRPFPCPHVVGLFVNQNLYAHPKAKAFSWRCYVSGFPLGSLLSLCCAHEFCWGLGHNFLPNRPHLFRLAPHILSRKLCMRLFCSSPSQTSKQFGKPKFLEFLENFGPSKSFSEKVNEQQQFLSKTASWRPLSYKKMSNNLICKQIRRIWCPFLHCILCGQMLLQPPHCFVGLLPSGFVWPQEIRTFLRRFLEKSFLRSNFAFKKSYGLPIFGKNINFFFLFRWDKRLSIFLQKVFLILSKIIKCAASQSDSSSAASHSKMSKFLLKAHLDELVPSP